MQEFNVSGRLHKFMIKHLYIPAMTKQLRYNKSPGDDEITVKVLNYGANKPL